jgi:hypothetical protein
VDSAARGREEGVDLVHQMPRRGDREQVAAVEKGEARIRDLRPHLFGEQWPAACGALVSADGRELRVRGLDAVDGTPVLDLKPVMRQFIPARVQQPDWVDAPMREYFTARP